MITGSPRVLVVESVRETREILSLILCIHGADVAEARTIGAGVEIAAAFAPEVILAGLARPARNVEEAVRALRSNDNTAQVPIVVVLPQHGSWAVPLGEWLPPEQILRSPVDPSRLVRSVQQAATMN